MKSWFGWLHYCSAENRLTKAGWKFQIDTMRHEVVVVTVWIVRLATRIAILYRGSTQSKPNQTSWVVFIGVGGYRCTEKHGVGQNGRRRGGKKIVLDSVRGSRGRRRACSRGQQFHIVVWPLYCAQQMLVIWNNEDNQLSSLIGVPARLLPDSDCWCGHWPGRRWGGEIFPWCGLVEIINCICLKKYVT